MPALKTRRVSVLMPAYNAATTIAAAIRSMLAQSWTNLEMVVVDDGSTDATADIAEALGARDMRVRCIRQTNKGVAIALNAGLKACSGDYVARMDADDISLPWRIRRQVEFMDAHPDVAASGTAILPFQSRAPWIGLPTRMPTDDDGVRTRLLFNPPIMHPTAILRRSIVERDDFYATSMPQAQDYELWSRLALTQRLSNIPTVCLFYRRSANSISSGRRQEQQERARALRLRNLALLCGEEFAAYYGDSHAEMMERRYTPLALVEGMPSYVARLVAQAGMDRRVIENLWLGYCAGYIRAGGDGFRLYAKISPHLTHAAFLRMLAIVDLLQRS